MPLSLQHAIRHNVGLLSLHRATWTVHIYCQSLKFTESEGADQKFTPKKLSSPALAFSPSGLRATMARLTSHVQIIYARDEFEKRYQYTCAVDTERERRMEEKKTSGTRLGRMHRRFEGQHQRTFELSPSCTRPSHQTWLTWMFQLSALYYRNEKNMQRQLLRQDDCDAEERFSDSDTDCM